MQLPTPPRCCCTQAHKDTVLGRLQVPVKDVVRNGRLQDLFRLEVGGLSLHPEPLRLQALLRLGCGAS